VRRPGNPGRDGHRSSSSRKIERYGLTRTIDPQHFFPTIDVAVDAFREETGAQWAAAGQSGQPDRTTTA
jgi:hypothetical protein